MHFSFIPVHRVICVFVLFQSAMRKTSSERREDIHWGNSNVFLEVILVKGTAVAQWLRCCTTNRKVAGSIPDGVIGNFLWRNPSDRTMVLGSTRQKWVPGEFPGGKCGRCVRLTTLPPSCAVVMKSGNLNFLEPSGPLRACNGTDLPILVNPCEFFHSQVMISCNLKCSFQPQ